MLLPSAIFCSPDIRLVYRLTARSPPFMYTGLRGFIGEGEKLRAPRHGAGADPHGEIGAITEVAAGLPEWPALLFDRIKGYPAGVRVFTNATTNPQRAALALGI